ncbi:UDP-4-amino-4,6-dideoxy-N-acetyl-beta-L-altrosamine N-acetyltransferase [Escherichia coli]
MNSLGCLRNITDEEVDLMLSWRNEPKVRRNMYTQHLISKEEHYAWWDKMKHRQDQCYYMYEFMEQPCGIASFNNLDVNNKNSAWAFYTSPLAPKGSGARMEFLMLDLAFITLGLHKLYCEVLEFNKAVISLHHKFGFETEGLLKEHSLIDDNFVNVHRLAILKDKWIFNRATQLEILTTTRGK